MEFWKEYGPCEDDKRSVFLKGARERLVSITETDKGFEFYEECDHHFRQLYSKEDALKLIDELRELILKK